jgi:DNA gyrase subunit A
MGRDTSGIKGMNVGGKDNRVLAMDIARNDTELFVVTENGYGKRTPVSDYPVKGRGTKGVLTIRITEKKGGLAGALIVNPHQDLLFISQNGMVQRTGVSGISQMGRSTQGVKVMNIKDDDRVSAVALAAESEDDIDIPATSSDPNADQIAIEAGSEADPSVNGASEDGAVPEDDVEE